MKLTRTNKLLLTLGSVGVAASIAGAGTWATFTDTDTATQDVSAGTVALNLGTTSFSTAIDDLAPGDTVQKAFTMDNDGSLDFGQVELVSTTDNATGDDRDLFDGSPAPADALQVKVERCDAGWTVGTGGLLECADGALAVLAETEASGASGVLSNLALEAGASNDLVATYWLPVNADNEVQGDSGTLTFTFTATQRAGQAR